MSNARMSNARMSNARMSNARMSNARIDSAGSRPHTHKPSKCTAALIAPFNPLCR